MTNIAKTEMRKLRINSEIRRAQVEKNGLHEAVRNRVDYEFAEERKSAIMSRDRTSLVDGYRWLAALPNLRKIERIVRWVARGLGHDEAELWADVMDKTAADIVADNDDKELNIGPNFPRNTRWIASKMVANARLIGTTGKYRRNRIKSKNSMPIEGMERQPGSPNWPSYVGPMGQTMRPLSSRNIHYVSGHKSPGIPESDAFKPAGFMYKHFAEAGLISLYDALLDNINWQEKRGYYSINWSQTAADYAGLDKRKDWRLVAEFKTKVMEFMRQGFDKYRTVEADFTLEKTGRVSRINPRNGEEISLSNRDRYADLIQGIGGDMSDITSDINRSVATRDWMVNNTKHPAKVDHYRWHKAEYVATLPAMVYHAKCVVCREIKADLSRQVITNKTLVNLHK